MLLLVSGEEGLADGLVGSDSRRLSIPGVSNDVAVQYLPLLPISPPEQSQAEVKAQIKRDKLLAQVRRGGHSDSRRRAMANCQACMLARCFVVLS